MFSVAYLSRYCDDNISRKNVHYHSICAILVGRDATAKAFLFYLPDTKRTLTSDDFIIDETLPSGPAFDLDYDGGLYFNIYTDYNDQLQPPIFTLSQQISS